MNAKDAAAQLEITVATVYALCRSGDLTHMRVGAGGKTIRLDQSDIDDYKRRARERAAGVPNEPSPPEYVLRNFRPKARGPRPARPAGAGARGAR